MNTRTLLVMLGTLVGCGGTSGEIDGESVGGQKDAIFDRVNILGVDLTLLWISDMSDSCEALEQIIDAPSLECDQTCEELGEVYEEYLGNDDYWTLASTLRVESDIEGTYSYENDLVLGEGEFQAEFLSWDVALWADYEACLDECQMLDNVTGGDGTMGESGSIEITSGDDTEITGSFSMTFDGEGELEGSFTATRCDMADWAF